MKKTTKNSTKNMVVILISASLFHVLCAIGASGAGGALWA